MPAGGKTGTTQNWADAWTCGITPYYAAAFWFGFDKPGQSLGLNITGATLAGYAWGEYFDKIHADLPYKNWIKPLEGVIECTVCADSGMIMTESCEHSTTQWYLEGTQPTEICPIHSSTSNSVISIIRLEREMYKSGQRMSFDFDTTPLTFDLNAPLTSDYDSSEDEEEEEDIVENSTSKFDYNYLME
jgi:penicillin-binding protein 1A